MSSEIWRSLTEDRMFNISMFRRGTLYLCFSLCISLVLIIFSFYQWSNKPIPDFYASDGIRMPIQLKPLSEPNKSSTYLLPPDPIETEDESTKVMPQ